MKDDFFGKTEDDKRHLELLSKLGEVYVYKELEQNSPEWCEARGGRMTASPAQKVMTIPKKVADRGKLSDGAVTHILDRLNEILTGKFTNFKNYSMDHGHKFEPEAGVYYENKYNVKLEKVGFISVGSHFGCSPDRLCGEFGTVQIKCPTAGGSYLKHLFDNKIEKDFIAQCNTEMFFSKRRWCDLFLYYTEAKSDSQRSIRIRFERNIDYLETLTERLLIYKNEYDEMLDLFLEDGSWDRTYKYD